MIILLTIQKKGHTIGLVAYLFMLVERFAERKAGTC
jgi:hypothetical protein